MSNEQNISICSKLEKEHYSGKRGVMHENKLELNLQRIHVSHVVFSISTGTFSAIDQFTVLKRI